MISIEATVSGANLTCQYHTGLIEDADQAVYYCEAVNQKIFDGTRLSIDSVNGVHTSGKTNDDVTAIVLTGISNLNFMPRNLEKIFKNLISIKFDGSMLIDISKDDLKPFPNLKYFKADNSYLKVIEANLFQFNYELLVIWLRTTPITHIHPNAFDGLDKLRVLRMTGITNCPEYFLDAVTKADVIRTIYRIKTGACINEFVLKAQKLAKAADSCEFEQEMRLKIEKLTSEIANLRLLLESEKEKAQVLTILAQSEGKRAKNLEITMQLLLTHNSNGDN